MAGLADAAAQGEKGTGCGRAGVRHAMLRTWGKPAWESTGAPMASPDACWVWSFCQRPCQSGNT